MPEQQGRLLKQPLDAPVRVTEALFQPQHLFADDREAKMPRLDNARMDWPDGNLVNTISRDGHKRIICFLRFKALTAG